MPSAKSKTPWCDEIRKTFVTFQAKPPTSNTHWEDMVRKVEKAIVEAAARITELKAAGNKTALKNATADAKAIADLKAEVRKAREDWNEGQQTR